MGNPGMRIVKHVDRPAQDIIDAYKGKAAANVADCTGRLFAMNAAIAPMGKGTKICGPALTVKSAIADNAMFHKAMSMAQPGDVIVVNACSDVNHSVCGDVMFRYAISKGIAGFVVDGCIRDLDFLKEHDFPVYALGATPRGPYKNPIGEINTDIAVGGQVVHPGDIIVGDEDGITVVRKEDAEDILKKLEAVREKEDMFSDLIATGTWDEKSPLLKSINEMLTKGGFEFID